MASDDGDPSVLVNRSLPKEPRLFAMVHKLKHHYCDQKLLKNGQIRCGDYNANELIEKAAEVFAAEFIYPSREFLDCAESLGLKKGEVTPEEVVELKRACGAPISTSSFTSRLAWFGFINPDEFAKVQFQKLEEEICGVPTANRGSRRGGGDVAKPLRNGFPWTFGLRAGTRRVGAFQRC